MYEQDTERRGYSAIHIDTRTRIVLPPPSLAYLAVNLLSYWGPAYIENIVNQIMFFGMNNPRKVSSIWNFCQYISLFLHVDLG